MPPASPLSTASIVRLVDRRSGASESQEWAFQSEVEAVLYGNGFAEQTGAVYRLLKRTGVQGRTLPLKKSCIQQGIVTQAEFEWLRGHLGDVRSFTLIPIDALRSALSIYGREERSVALVAALGMTLPDDWQEEEGEEEEDEKGEEEDGDEDDEDNDDASVAATEVMEEQLEEEDFCDDAESGKAVASTSGPAAQHAASDSTPKKVTKFEVSPTLTKQQMLSMHIAPWHSTSNALADAWSRRPARAIVLASCASSSGWETHSRSSPHRHSPYSRTPGLAQWRTSTSRSWWRSTSVSTRTRRR